MTQMADFRAKILAALGVVALLGGCAYEGERAESASGPSQPSLAFVEASCGGCHSVERQGISPNPDAPPFAAIANQEGLNEATLETWLLDAHNYPEEMEFELEQPEVAGLVNYILTLRDPNYRPGI